MIAMLHPINLVIVYYSRFGVVRTLASEIELGAHQTPLAAVDVHLVEVEDQPMTEPQLGETSEEAAARLARMLDLLASADALVVGAPAYFGSMASPVKRFFEDCLTEDGQSHRDRARPWQSRRFPDKVGAAFTASGTPHGGNEETLQSILTMFMHLGMIVVTPGQGEPILEYEAAPYGATVITGASGDRTLSGAEQEWARALGRRVVETALWLRWGRDECDRLREIPLPVD